MSLKRRITAVSLTLALGLGGAVAVPTAASAAQNRSMTHTGMQTKALCEYAKGSNIRHIIARGGTIHGGEGCLYAGATRKWMYTILYRL